MIEIIPGIYYCEETGNPYTTRKRGGGKKDSYFYKEPIPIIGKSNKGYYRIWLNGKTVAWHRLVYEFFNGKIPENMQVDHKNNIRDDNRIENLQLLTPTQNCRSSLKPITNTSGFKGVCWHKYVKKWCAKINYNNKRISLGYFDDPEAAHQSYLQAKIKYHGKDTIRT